MELFNEHSLAAGAQLLCVVGDQLPLCRFGDQGGEPLLIELACHRRVRNGLCGVAGGAVSVQQGCTGWGPPGGRVPDTLSGILSGAASARRRRSSSDDGTELLKNISDCSAATWTLYQGQRRELLLRCAKRAQLVYRGSDR